MNDPHAHRPRRPAPTFAPLLACGAAGALFLLAGCGGGGQGDPPVKALGNEYGPGARLCNVVGPATWEDPANQMSAGCKTPPDHGVYVTGVTIVAIDRYDETGTGAIGNYYVEDTTCAGKPYAGMTIFGPSFSPPDLRLAANDVVDVNGVLGEFIGPSSSPFGSCKTLPEVSGTLSFRFDGASAPEPVVIKDTDLKTYDTARPYLGMLVKVTGGNAPNVVLNGDASNSGGRYTVALSVGGGAVPDQPKITNELYDIEAEGPALKDTMTFTSVTGIVTYFYGFHISPRSPADFEL